MYEEGLVIGWCDPGTTDSLFTSSLVSLFLHGKEIGLPEKMGISQSIGNQIARQRGELLQAFHNTNLEWLLWVDSDININPESVRLLWEAADPVTRPIISGVYFISMEPHQPLMAPFPCIFTDDGVQNLPIHPLPQNQLIPIDVAGLGFTLMHRSVSDKLLEKYGKNVFDISFEPVHKSEDISFFRKVKELGIPAYAHTGALVEHIKRYNLDINYYYHWWNTVAPLRDAAERARQEVLQQAKAESSLKRDNNL